MKLSIIIPTYNEHATIDQLVGYVQSVQYPIDYEIIIVDDASGDKTFEKTTVLRTKNREAGMRNIRIFKNNVNMGKGFSLRKGIRHATGDIIVIQDADTEYDPHEIPKLLEPILKGESDAVYGSRFLHMRRPQGMAFANWFANIFLTWLTNIFYGLNLTDMETCYKVIRAEILKDLDLRANRFTFEPEVTALLAKRKIKIVELPIAYKGRTAEEGKKIKAKDFLFAVLVLLKYLFAAPAKCGVPAAVAAKTTH